MNLSKIAQGLRLIADGLEPQNTAVEVPKEEVEAPKKKVAKKKVAKKATKKTAPKEEVEVEEKEVTEIEVRNAIKAYAKENSRDAAFEILGEFDANKVADLKKSQYAEVMARLQ